MKVFRYMIPPTGLIAAVAMLASVTVFAGTSSAHSAKAAQASCTGSIGIEAPFASGPAVPLGLEQVHFAELAVAQANAANNTNITLDQQDTGLMPSKAESATMSIIASPDLAVVGPAGSQEVEAVGPLFGNAGMAFVSGSATLPALTTSGMNPTFFRVVPDDNVQGPADANYIIKHKLAGPKGSTILVINDDEAYSEGLATVVTPLFKAAGFKVDSQTYNGADTGATLQSALSSLATAQVTSKVHLVFIPWQSAGNAQQFGKTLEQQKKKVVLFGTDGTNAPGTFTIPGSYSSNFGPDISQSKSALDTGIVSGVAKYGPYGPFGVPTWQATTVVMDAIATACKAGTPSRASVLAAIKATNIPASQSPEGVPIAFAPGGNLKAQAGYLFKIGAGGKYTEIPDK